LFFDGLKQMTTYNNIFDYQQYCSNINQQQNGAYNIVV